MHRDPTSDRGVRSAPPTGRIYVTRRTMDALNAALMHAPTALIGEGGHEFNNELAAHIARCVVTPDGA